MRFLQKLSALISLLFLMAINTLFAQELLDEISIQDEYYYSPMALNNNWLFTPSGAEGSDGVIIYKKENGRWIFNDRIPQTNSWDFGFNLDSYGDWLIVGDGQDYSEQGESLQSLHFYKFEDDAWTFKQKFTRDISYFTSAFSIHGEWVIAGDYRRDSLYVYHLENDTWVRHQSIGYDDSTHWNEVGPHFGRSVKMYGDYFVVSAPEYYPNDEAPLGAFYLFKRQQDNNFRNAFLYIITNSKAKVFSVNGFLIWILTPIHLFSPGRIQVKTALCLFWNLMKILLDM